MSFEICIIDKYIGMIYLVERLKRIPILIYFQVKLLRILLKSLINFLEITISYFLVFL